MALITADAGDVSIDSAGPLQIGWLQAGGDAIMTSQGNLTLSGFAATGSVSLSTLDALLADGTSQAGSISATALGNATVNLTATMGDVSLVTLASLSGDLSGGGKVRVMALSGFADLSLEGDQGVELASLGGGSAELDSLAGPIEALTGQASSLSVWTSGDVKLTSLGALAAEVEAGGSVQARSGGNLMPTERNGGAP